MGGHNTGRATQCGQDRSSAQGHECCMQPQQIWTHPLCIPQPQSYTTGHHHPSGRNNSASSQADQVRPIPGGNANVLTAAGEDIHGIRKHARHITAQVCRHPESPSSRMHIGQMRFRNMFRRFRNRFRGFRNVFRRFRNRFLRFRNMFRHFRNMFLRFRNMFRRFRDMFWRLRNMFRRLRNMFR